MEQVRLLEKDLNEREENHLKHPSPYGNFKLGWSNNPMFQGDKTKTIEVDAKDKIFSLSSIKSAAMEQLGNDPDRQLQPFGEKRFQSKSKYSF